MDRNSRVFVAGARGLVGSGLVRHLRRSGYVRLLVPTREQLDLMDSTAVEAFFAAERPEYVFAAAARVGGIVANDRFRADFIRENLNIQMNLIDGAYRHGVRKFMFLGSSCIYPKLARQPMREDCLLTGPLEPTNAAYAIAKIAGIELARSYRIQYGFNAITAMPTNIYGPGDNYHPEHSHVIPGLITRLHAATVERRPYIVVWGTGAPRREFLHVDDLADACVFLMKHYEEEGIINVGVGRDISIAELARTIADVVGFRGAIRFDAVHPDGAPRKLLDVSRLQAMGWRARIALKQGLAETYQSYRAALPHAGQLGQVPG
jgi:GDP-L-fucose synthase